MTYVISDLHGYPLEKFKMLLEKAEFSDNDFLYILGDVIDRNGDGGVEMLCWLLKQQKKVVNTKVFLTYTDSIDLLALSNNVIHQ